MTSIPNLHRYLIAFLAALLAVCIALSTGAVAVPPALHDVAPYAALAVVFLTAFLPHFGAETQGVTTLPPELPKAPPPT